MGRTTLTMREPILAMACMKELSRLPFEWLNSLVKLSLLYSGKEEKQQAEC